MATLVEKMRDAVEDLAELLDEARAALGSIERLQESYDVIAGVLELMEHEETKFQPCGTGSYLSPQTLYMVTQALGSTEWQVEQDVDEALRRLCEQAERVRKGASND